MDNKPFKVGTVCTGIGAIELALRNLGVKHELTFGCEIDKYPKASFLANFSPLTMYDDMTKEAWDKPSQNTDFFFGGIPCQSFSLAGKRLGELDPRGLLILDFHRYVKNNRPKVFGIENVKGLLSDNKGKTFQNWLLILGDAVNGHRQMFNHPDSLGYNLYWCVLNTKDFGLPQNRERVFIIGIRPDVDNGSFRFPKGWKLKKRLKDVLETHVEEKYYLSEKALEYMSKPATGGYSDRLSFMNDAENETSGCITANHSKGIPYNVLKVKETTNLQGKEYINTIRSSGRGSFDLQHNWDMIIEEGKLNSSQDGRVLNTDGISQCLSSEHNNMPKIVTKEKNDAFIQGGLQEHQKPRFDGISPTLTSAMGMGGGQTPIHNYYTRIRKLTPLECWRLQGFTDETFFNAKGIGMSDTQLYKQAGNSISEPVIRAIIKNFIHLL